MTADQPSGSEQACGSRGAAVLSHPSQVTARWLETVLDRRVRSFECRSETSTWATHVRIVADVEGMPAPSKLRVKLGSAKVFGRSEVDYYLKTFIDLADAPLVRCHHAAADDTHYHLLLDDLTDTHRNQDDVPVTEAYGRGLVESIARLQGHRWAPSPPEAAAIDASLRGPLAGLPVMLAAMEEGFTASERAKVAEVFDRLPQALVDRARDPAGFSWVHGDLNPGNILAPSNGAGRVLLIDYQPFGVTAPSQQLAMSDLAYAMVLWWPEAARREFASRLVDHWYERLHPHGPGRASSGRSAQDWALCVAQTLLVPASRCSEADAVTTHRWLWQMHVRRALAALMDSREW